MRKRKLLFATILLVAMLLAAVLLSLYLGSRSVTMTEILRALSGKDQDSFVSKAIRTRIPRTIFGLIAGAALGISGCIMQSTTRNPVADPSILGVNTGAALFVVVGIIVFHITTARQYIWLALIGAAVTTVFVYGIASLGASGVTPLKLALAGATVSTALGSLISTLVLPDQHAMNTYRFWQVGSIGAASWDSIELLLPFFSAGTLLACIMAPYLNMTALGDEMATSLGVNVRLVRILSCIAGVILCGATTALAGPIGFVGLMVPHLLRALIGGDIRFLMPLSAMAGGALLLLSDVIGRVIGRPGETEVGIVTSLIGAPIFIYIIRKAKVRTL